MPGGESRTDQPGRKETGWLSKLSPRDTELSALGREVGLFSPFYRKMTKWLEGPELVLLCGGGSNPGLTLIFPAYLVARWAGMCLPLGTALPNSAGSLQWVMVGAQINPQLRASC